MSSTPKPVRRMIKRARREAANYFGEKGFYPKIKMNHEGINSSRTRMRNDKRPRTKIKLGFEPRESLRKRAFHEMFHGAHNEVMLKQAGKSVSIVSEAIAIIGNIEHEMAAHRESPLQVLARLSYLLTFYPPRTEDHYQGLRIAINILQKHPNKKDRQDFVRGLLKRNAEVAKKAKEGEDIVINELGEISLKTH